MLLLGTRVLVCAWYNNGGGGEGAGQRKVVMPPRITFERYVLGQFNTEPTTNHRLDRPTLIIGGITPIEGLMIL